MEAKIRFKLKALARLSVPRRPIKTCLKFHADQNGGIAVMFSLALLPLIMLAGVAVDFGAMRMHQAKLQAAADTGALLSAKELRLAQLGQASAVTAMAKAYASAMLTDVKNQLTDGAVDAVLIDDNASIRVTVTAIYEPKLLRLLHTQHVKLAAQATATSVGYPVCALALDPQSAQTIYARTQAQITAQYCAIQSNSKDAQAIYPRATPLCRRARFVQAEGLRGASRRRP